MSQADDLAVVERDFLSVDRSYNAEELGRAVALLKRLKSEANSLSPAQFELALAELAAIADNAHTVVNPTLWPGRYNQLPVRFAVFSDGLRLVSADEPHKRLIGAKVRSINGRSLDQLRQVWSKYRSGRSGFRDEYLPLFLESPELLHAAGIAADPEAVAVRLEQKGAVSEAIIKAHAHCPARDWQFIPPSHLIELSRSIPDAGKPLYLRQPDALFQLVPLPRHHAYYLQFRSNRGPTIPVFAKRAMDVLRKARPRFIILDERFNAGGSLSSTRDLMQALPDILGPNGRIFILTSGRTFSAAIASVAYAKQAAKDRAIIIGTPVGEGLEFWAEGSPIELPYSHVIIQPSPKRHNYTNGCPEADCHASVHLHPIRVSSIEPDVTVGLTYDDFIKGRDPLLDAALRRMGKEKR